MNPLKVGITHGDVNGVSYEIILKSLAEEEILELFTPIIFGVGDFVEKTKELIELPNLKINKIDDPSSAKDGIINLVELKGPAPEFHPGEVRKDAGQSAIDSLETAVESLKKGEIDVLVTAPISKEAVQSESFPFPGHTEYLTSRLGSGRDALMILCNDTLRVALLTVHVPVTKIAENITVEKIKEAAKDFSETLKKDFGILRPTIAVLSLNPHAGDGGVIGKEEQEIISPAIEQLFQDGVYAFGPFPADGFFGHGNYKKFDGVLAMYHDQGLAPFKTIATNGGVNFTANLPFVRTSPDHGTAYDIAWKGVADETSMKEAIYMAIDIFRRRRNFETTSANPLQKYVTERPDRGERQEKPIKKTTQPAEMSND